MSASEGQGSGKAPKCKVGAWISVTFSATGRYIVFVVTKKESCMKSRSNCDKLYLNKAVVSKQE